MLPRCGNLSVIKLLPDENPKCTIFSYRMLKQKVFFAKHLVVIKKCYTFALAFKNKAIVKQGRLAQLV